MLFKIGDKVCFLHEKLEGIVTKVLEDNKYEVTTSDDFGFPVLGSELVLVERGNESSDLKTISKNNVQGLNLLIEDCGTSLQFHLQNNSKQRYYIAVRVYKKDEWVNVFSGEIGRSKIVDFEAVGKQFINVLGDMYFEAICTEWSLKDLSQPLVELIKIKPTKLAKPESFKPISGLDNDAVCISLFKNSLNRGFSKEEVEKLTDKDFAGAKEESEVKQSKKHAHRRVDLEEEIDLHIENLTDNWKSLSNGEIVQIQLDHASKAIDQCIKKGIHRLSIIHGVGAGTLKSEVRKLIQSYEGLSFEDGDFSKYGNGATLVRLK